MKGLFIWGKKGLSPVAQQAEMSALNTACETQNLLFSKNLECAFLGRLWVRLVLFVCEQRNVKLKKEWHTDGYFGFDLKKTSLLLLLLGFKLSQGSLPTSYAPSY